MMQSATAAIEARSHREVMDWALVLASQGIECVVDRRPEDHVWILQVAADMLPAANVAISTYEKENTTIWRQEVRWTGLLFDWRSVFWWIVVIALHFLSTDVRPGLSTAGVMDRASFFAGAWWRAFTAVTLHADVAHLALNASTGLLLLGLAMGFYGTGKALLLAYCAGAGANVIEAFLRPEQYHALGASGMVMAALGLLAAQSLFERHYSAREWIGRGVLGAGLLLILIGLDTKSDVLAHLLGAACGFVLGAIVCALGRRVLRSPWLDTTAAVLTAGILILAWGLAIRHAPG